MCLLSFDTNDTNNHINHWKICEKVFFFGFRRFICSYSVLEMMRTVCCVLTMSTAIYENFAFVFLLLICFCFEAMIRKSWQHCHIMSKEEKTNHIRRHTETDGTEYRKWKGQTYENTHTSFELHVRSEHTNTHAHTAIWWILCWCSATVL